MNDSPHQKAIVAISRTMPRRTPRIGDSQAHFQYETLDEETNMALLEADETRDRRPGIANIGFSDAKRRLRGS